MSGGNDRGQSSPYGRAGISDQCLKVKEMAKITIFLVPLLAEFFMIIWVYIMLAQNGFLNIFRWLEAISRVECARSFLKLYGADPKPLLETIVAGDGSLM